MADGVGVLNKLQEQTFDLIFMDVQMPIMDGLEATRRIKQLPGGADVPVICVSASAFDDDVKAAHEAGCVGFQSKPVRLHEVVETIEHHAKISFEEPMPVEVQVDRSKSRKVSLSSLPDEIRRRLIKCAIECDSDAILSLCGEFEHQDAEAAQAVRAFAADYRFDLMQEALAA